MVRKVRWLFWTLCTACVFTSVICCWCSSCRWFVRFLLFATRSCFFAMLRFILCTFLMGKHEKPIKAQQWKEKRNLLSAKDITHKNCSRVHAVWTRLSTNDMYTAHTHAVHALHLWFSALRQIKCLFFSLFLSYFEFKLYNYSVYAGREYEIAFRALKRCTQHTHTAKYIHLKRAKWLWSCLSRSKHIIFFPMMVKTHLIDRKSTFIWSCVCVCKQMHWIECMKQVSYLRRAYANIKWRQMRVSSFVFFSIRANLSMTTWLGTNVNAFPFERSTFEQRKNLSPAARDERKHTDASIRRFHWTFQWHSKERRTSKSISTDFIQNKH